MSEQEHDQIASLRAERDELERRAVEAETVAEQLAEQLADAQRRLAEQRRRRTTDHLSLFGGAAPAEPRSNLAPDGSDRAVLPMALLATAVVAFLVAVVTIVAGRFSAFTVVALGVAAAPGVGRRADPGRPGQRRGSSTAWSRSSRATPRAAST